MVGHSRFISTCMIAGGLLVAAGLSVPNASAQQPPPEPQTPAAQQSQSQQPSQPRDASRANRAGLGVDVVTTQRGVLVANVREGSPAAKVGLRRGDQIVSFGGQSVSSAEAFLSRVGEQQPDSTVKAEIRRNGELVDMAIVLGSGDAATDRDATQQPSPRESRQRPEQPERGRGQTQRGQQQADAPRAAPGRPGERQQTARYQPPSVWAGFILERAPLGVVIERLHPEGPARQAGLRQGDRIVRVNGRVTAEPEEVYEAVERSQAGDELRLTVLRGEDLIEGSLRVDTPPPGVIDRPADGMGMPGAESPELARLLEQQRQNTEMIRDLMREVRSLREELDALRSGGARSDRNQGRDDGRE